MSTARAYATVTGPTATFTAPDGRTEQLHADNSGDIRLSVVARAATEAHRAGEPVELVTAGDRGDHHLLVHIDGAVTTLPHPRAVSTRVGDPTPGEPAPVSDQDQEADAPGAARDAGAEAPPRDQVAPAEPAAAVPAEADVGEQQTVGPRTFITTGRTGVTSAPGVRGWPARLGVRPSRVRQQRDEDVAAVSRQWAGSRAIAVVNGKGGVGKTMTTAMLAAVYARHGGGNVLAWDNNDTRGTLGWRTEQGLYDTTIRDLLRDADTLLAPHAGVADITGYVHHQGTDRYDVLRSNPELLATDQRLDSAEFDRLAAVTARYYRLVVFDSGNDESSDRWTRMVDSAHQLVIPTLTAPESAESALLLLDALRTRDERSARLADDAVVVVTEAERGQLQEVVRIVAGFADQVRQVTVIPFDKALKSGPLRFDALTRRVRNAWIHTAATATLTL